MDFRTCKNFTKNTQKYTNSTTKAELAKNRISGNQVSGNHVSGGPPIYRFYETILFPSSLPAHCCMMVVVVFPQAPFRVTNVPGHASAGIIQLRNCTLASLYDGMSTMTPKLGNVDGLAVLLL